ncbi:MAG: lipopolysaccharide kinase InaA family protein [Planctomycetota bacterium]
MSSGVDTETQASSGRPANSSLARAGVWKWTFVSATDCESSLGPARKVVDGWDDLRSWPGARVLKSNALRTVFSLPTAPDRGLVVKQYHLRGTADRLKYLVLPSRARAEWHALTRLAAAGLSVPRVLAYGEERRGPTLLRAGLIMERIENVTGLAEWLDAPREDPGQRPALLERVGRTLAALHESGARHDDLHSGNLLVSPGGEVPWQLHLIDHHVCRFGPRPPGDRRRRRDLAKFLHSLGPSLRGSEVSALLAAYDHARPSRDRWGAAAIPVVLTDLERRARGLELVRLRSRARRCWKNSTEFVREERDGWQIHRRRDLAADSLTPFLNGGFVLDPEFKRRADSAVGVAKLGAGQSVIVKTRCLTRWWRRLAHLFVRGPLEQAWGAARALDVHGIPTPRALALLTRRRFGLPWEAILITERIEHARSLWAELMDVYYPPSEKSRAGLVQRIAPLAQWVRRFHDTGIYHRDLNPANLLVASGETQDRFYAIDLDSVVAGRRLSERRRRKNLVQLALIPEGHVTPRDRLRFLRDYDRGERRYYDRASIGRLNAELAAEVVSMVGRMSLREWQTARRARASAR